MSRTYYHRHFRRYYHPPRWFTNLIVVRPERRVTKKQCKQVVCMNVNETDTLMWPEGNKPDAAWDWY